jgi:hypothetical protein
LGGGFHYKYVFRSILPFLEPNVITRETQSDGVRYKMKAGMNAFTLLSAHRPK